MIYSEQKAMDIAHALTLSEETEHPADRWTYKVEPTDAPGYACVAVYDEHGQFVQKWGE